MIVPKSEHTHTFTEVELYRIVKVHKNYAGTTGDKAFLMRVCDCGQQQAFEYGKYRDMMNLQNELAAREVRAQHLAHNRGEEVS